MEVYLFKLNGWPDNFDERVVALADSVDSLIVIRSSPKGENQPPIAENLEIIDIVPKRGNFVRPAWAKPVVFSLHTAQAVVWAFVLMLIRRKRPDAVHAVDYILGGVAAMIISTTAQVPLVLSVRGLKEPAYRNVINETGGIRPRINYKILIFLSNIVVPRADYIITKSNYQEKLIRERFEVHAEFTAIPTGVDFKKFDPRRIPDEDAIADLFSERTSSIKDKTVILHLGKLIPRKGVDQLLEFISENKNELPDDVLFVLIGEFRDPDFEMHIERLSNDLSNVLIHPERVPFSRVPALLKASDAVVLLSEPDNEGVPRILQEACVMEKPIIASDVTGISDMFENIAGCHLINRNDPSEFLTAVRGVVQNEVKPNRESLRTRFDIRRNYQSYGDVYSHVIP